MNLCLDMLKATLTLFPLWSIRGKIRDQVLSSSSLQYQTHKWLQDNVLNRLPSVKKQRRLQWKENYYFQCILNKPPRTWRQCEMGQYACLQRNSIFKSCIANDKCFYLALFSNAEPFCTQCTPFQTSRKIVFFLAFDRKFSFEILLSQIPQ